MKSVYVMLNNLYMESEDSRELVKNNADTTHVKDMSKFDVEIKNVS